MADPVNNTGGELMENEEKKNPTWLEKLMGTGKTVRQRKKSVTASTQRFLPISEIRNDTVILKNGGLRAVLEVEALNFNLKSETEQQGIIAGYQGFVNTILFPVQICIRSTHINIDPYIARLRTMAERQTNELLKDQTLSYASFVERIVEIADIMQKKFYVVIPLDDVPARKSTLTSFFSWMGVDDTLSKALQRSRQFDEKSVKLKETVAVIESGLHNVGLNTRRLQTTELIKLYYEIFNPKTSAEQRLPSLEQLKMAENVL